MSESLGMYTVEVTISNCVMRPKKCSGYLCVAMIGSRS